MGVFAAFPAVYAGVFSGFYPAMMLLLVALIFRAVAIEFRSKQPMAWWRRTWDISFSAASFLGSFLMGVAFGNVIQGIPLDGRGEYLGGFLLLLNPYALLTGLTTVVVTHIIEEAVFLGQHILVLGRPPNVAAHVIKNPEACDTAYRSRPTYWERCAELREALNASS